MGWGEVRDEVCEGLGSILWGGRLGLSKPPLPPQEHIQNAKMLGGLLPMCYFASSPEFFVNCFLQTCLRIWHGKMEGSFGEISVVSVPRMQSTNFLRRLGYTFLTQSLHEDGSGKSFRAIAMCLRVLQRCSYVLCNHTRHSV